MEPNSWSIGGFQFDAWLRLHTNASLTITEHPVETGTAISDHSYRNPRQWSFDIGMSDCVTGGYQGGSQSRSVNAINTLLALQQTRALLTLTMKYGVYANVLIKDIDISDDYTTANAAKPTVVLQEVILANGNTVKVTTTPQVVSQTSRGTVTAQPVPTLLQNVVTFFSGFKF